MLVNTGAAGVLGGTQGPDNGEGSLGVDALEEARPKQS